MFPHWTRRNVPPFHRFLVCAGSTYLAKRAQLQRCWAWLVRQTTMVITVKDRAFYFQENVSQIESLATCRELVSGAVATG